MKNFNKFSIILFSLLALLGCDDDDKFDAATETHNPTTEVTINFTDNNNEANILEDGGTITLDISLSNALTTDGMVYFEVTSSDGSLETTSGVTEVNYTDTIAIPAGSTSAQLTLTFSDDTINDGTENYTVRIINFQADLQTDSHIINGTDTERFISVSDTPSIVNTIGGDVTVSLTWTNTAYNLDLYLVTGDQDFSGTVIDTSTGITTTETVVLPSNSIDDIYSLFSYEYYSAYPTSYTLTFDFEDGQQEIFNGTLSDESWTTTIIKNNDASGVTYTITQL